MTNFLSAAAVSEAIQDLHESCRYLETLLAMNESERARFAEANVRRGIPATVDEEVRKTVASMRETARAAKEFLDSLQSQPIIYTGEGTTEEVLALVERLFADRLVKKGPLGVQLEFGR